MTLNLDPHAAARPDVLPAEDRMLSPQALWKRYGLPRDLIYRAIGEGELPAYNTARRGRPRYLVALPDFLTWRESLRVAPAAKGNK
ncbi:hypothetical protein [Deinococcus sp. YIM 77859]|uniref:hypothetical protein n=1 Tax=Deinococcus sp. YIM 77859 TaxID=1540221 RepID=UPI000AFDA3C5|nr:hypothetical protein [Deinococcus sp. YIM 77859]